MSDKGQLATLLNEAEMELKIMLGSMQTAFNSAATIVNQFAALKDKMMADICEHDESERTGYYKSDIKGMYAFWCKGCQSEQYISEDEVE